MTISSTDDIRTSRISIIEDSEIHREWLKSELADNQSLHVVSADRLGKSGIESVKRLNPDLILIDFQLGDMTGLEVAKRIKLNDGKSRIFMLTAHTDISIIDRIISDKNIDAVAIKGSHYFELNFVSAIRHVVDGGTYLEPSILTMLRQSKNATGLSQLTKREFEIFIQINSSKTDQEIADDLCVEVEHVKNMKSRIIKKVKNDDLDSLLSKLIENSANKLMEVNI